MNPCPCGYLLNQSESYSSGSTSTKLYEANEAGGGSVEAALPPQVCTCRAVDIRRYLSKISASLLSNIDVHIEVRPQPELESFLGVVGEDSATVRKRVMATRARQRRRGPKLNAQLKGKALRDVCRISPSTQKSMDEAKEQFNFTAGRCDSMLRVARTIADMVGSEAVEKWHFEEAVNLRPFYNKIFA